MNARTLVAVTMALALLLAVLAGCGPAKPPATQPDPTVPAVASTKAPSANSKTEATATRPANTPAAAAKATAAPTSAPTAAGDTLAVNDRSAGLDKLTSYRARWRAEWKTSESGKSDSAAWDWTEEYTAKPEALHYIWASSDPGGKTKSSTMEMWQIGDTMYLVTKDESGQGDCMSFSSDDKDSGLTKGAFSPSSLGSVSNAKFVGSETMNGVQAKHYKYDDKSVTLGGFGSVAGDMWVANDGGWVVKDTMTWQGGAGLFGASANSKGEGKWTWEVLDANKPLNIKAPENCGGAAKGLPVMADATEKTSFGDIVMYKSASKLDDVVKFYEKEMPAAGWKASGEETKTDEMALLEYKKGDQTAQVNISTDGDAVQVMINVAK